MNFEEMNLVMDRTAWVECVGLPLIAWVEPNVKAFTKKMEEWISWTYQKDDSNDFFNPLSFFAYLA